MLKGSTNSDNTTRISSPQNSVNFIQQQELLRNRAPAIQSEASPVDLDKVEIENPCFGPVENFNHIKVPPPPPLVRPDEFETRTSQIENNQLQVLLTQTTGGQKAPVQMNSIYREDKISDVSPFRDEQNNWKCNPGHIVETSDNRVSSMLARKRSPATTNCFLSNVNGPLNLTLGGAELHPCVPVSSLAQSAALMSQVSPQVVTVDHPMPGTSKAAAVVSTTAQLIHNSKLQGPSQRKFNNPATTFREAPPPLVPAMSINNPPENHKLQHQIGAEIVARQPTIDAGYFKLVAVVDRQSPMDSKVHQLLSSLLLTPQGIDQAMASLVGVLLDWASGLKSIIPQSLFISIFTQQWCSLVLLTQIYHHKRHSHQDIQLKTEFVQRNINSDSEIVRKFSQSLQHLVYVQTKLHEMSLSREFYAALKVLLLLNKQKGWLQSNFKHCHNFMPLFHNFKYDSLFLKRTWK